MTDLKNNDQLVLIYDHRYMEEGNMNGPCEKPQNAGTTQINTFYYNKNDNTILLERTEHTFINADPYDDDDEDYMKTNITIYQFEPSVTLQHVVSRFCMQNHGANERLKCFNSLLEKSATVISTETIE